MGALGNFIKRIRTEKDLSLRDAAKLCNLSHSYISNLEKGIDSKTQKPVSPTMDSLEKLSIGLGVDINDLISLASDNPNIKPKKKGVKIPVLGRVQAGVPVEAIEEIIDYEEIDEELAKTGEFFCLQIRGDSMSPRMLDGDVVVVRKQPDLENGQVGIVLVNGQDATVKKIVKHETGISLVAFNSAYPTRIFTYEEIEKLPVVILGRVIELRGKF